MLFISKKVFYQPLLDFLSDRNIELVDTPMIRFVGESFECPKASDYDIVFFSSPRSVEFFLNHCKIEKDKIVASIGRATSEVLEGRNVPIHFQAVNSGRPKEISKSFSKIVKDKRVLFPQSSRSNRSMQQSLSKDQVLDLVIYNTDLDPKILSEKPEIIVLTSPSNAEAYLLSNSISDNQKVVAWGKTTEQYLLKEKIKVWHTLVQSSFEELTTLLKRELI